MQVAYRDVFFACLSALFLVLSFPRFDLNLLAWVSLVPLLIAIEGKGLKEAFLLSCLTGFIYFSGVFYWTWAIDAFKPLDYLLLGVLYLPQYIGIWGGSLNWIRKRTGLPPVLVAPSLWVTLEYVRGHASFLSMPWMLLGHSQYQNLSMIQITSITGVYGLSFLIVLINVAITDVVSYFRMRRTESSTLFSSRKPLIFSLTAGSVLLIATYGYGFSVLSNGIEGERIKIALVQGNISQEQKWNKANRQIILDRHASLTRKIAQEDPVLIVWPETSVPGDARHDPGVKDYMRKVAKEANAYLLVGSAENAKFTDVKLIRKYYNSMVFFTPEGNVAGEYRKILLVPFAEYEPLKGTIKWPKAIASSRNDITPGNKYTLFNMGNVTFGSTICWENIFPELFREFVKRGASFMVNATNEAHFKETAAPYQLLSISIFRAVENKVSIARVANTGISAIIDPFGRITERLRGTDQKELFVEGVLVGNIVTSTEKTFYTKYGDVFTFFFIAVSVFLILYSVIMGRVRQKLA